MTKPIILFFALVFAASASAQDWVSTGGPGGGFSQIVFNAKKDIFLSALYVGTLMRSTDGGKSWKNIAPLEAPQRTTWTIAIAPNQDIYITGQADSLRIWKSTDNGNSWSRIWISNVRITFIGADNTIYGLSGDGRYQLFRSKNFAKTWDTLLLSPLSGYLHSINSATNLIDSNGVLVLAVDFTNNGGSGFIISSDQGTTWQKILLGHKSIVSLVCGKKGNIFMITPDSAYHSSDDGFTWQSIASLGNLSGNGFFATNPNGQVLFSRSDLLLYSSDNGFIWNNVAFPAGAIYNTITICGDADSGFYLQNKNIDEAYHTNHPRSSWVLFECPTATVYAIAAFANSSLVVTTDPGGLLHSDSSQSNWKLTNYGTSNMIGNLFTDSNDNVFLLSNYVVSKTTDTGTTWKSSWDKFTSYVYDLVFFKNTILAALEGSLLISTNGGNSWALRNYNTSDYILGSHDGTLYQPGQGTLYRSNDTGKTFQQFALPKIFSFSAVFTTNIYGEIFAFANQNDLSAMYHSVDKGETWSLFNQGLACTNVTVMISLPDGSIAAATDSGVFILPLSRCIWQSYSTGLWSKKVTSIASDTQGKVFVSPDGCGVFKSTKLFNDTLKLTGVLDPSAIDYKTVTIGSATCIDVVLRNRGLKPFTISSFKTVDPIPFSLSDESAKKLPITLGPKDSVVMSICFHPFQPAVYSSQIVWNTDIDPSLCGISRTTELHGIATLKNSVAMESEFEFSVQANPVSSSADFSFAPLPAPKVFELFDLLGRRLYQKEISAGAESLHLDVQNYPEGIYLARLGNEQVKFMKE